MANTTEDEARSGGPATLEELLLDERRSTFPDLTVLGCLERAGNRYDGGWRQLVTDTVLHLCDRTEAHLAREERAAALVGRLLDRGSHATSVDREAVIQLEDERLFERVDAVTFSALLGYCLGRTAGAGAEALDGWLERALALADLDAAYRIAPPDEVWRRRLGAAPGV